MCKLGKMWSSYSRKSIKKTKQFIQVYCISLNVLVTVNTEKFKVKKMKNYKATQFKMA